jgi:hypothetical protein
MICIVIEVWQAEGRAATAALAGTATVYTSIDHVWRTESSSRRYPCGLSRPLSKGLIVQGTYRPRDTSFLISQLFKNLTSHHPSHLLYS